MKDEMGGIPILEFVGLRSKMYSFRWSLLDYTMKLKGIPTAIVQKELTFGKYKQSLLNQKETVTEMKLFRSNNHHVTTRLKHDLHIVHVPSSLLYRSNIERKQALHPGTSKHPPWHLLVPTLTPPSLSTSFS